jgi:ABC-2 type transport system permease protein
MSLATATTPNAVPARVQPGKVKKAISDGLVLTKRNLLHNVREPVEPSLALMVPIMLVLLFGYAFGEAMAVPGNGNYREFLIAGIFVMVLAYGTASTAQGIARDTDKAVFGRFRSMPMAPSALLSGRALSDMIRAIPETILVGGVGLLIGWTWHTPFSDVLGAIGLLLLLRLALIWGGMLLGMAVPAEAVTAIVYPLVMPLTFISSTFVAPSMMPSWLGTLAEWNPLSSVVNATRDLFGNPGVGGDTWIAQNYMLMAVVWPLALLALFVPLAVRKLQKLTI